MFANYITQQFLLSSEECDLIRKSCLKDLKVGELATPDDKGEVKESVRKAKTSFIFRDKGVYSQNEELKLVIDKVIWMFCNIAEEAFKCPLKKIEPIQFGQYGRGEFYDWHMDAGPRVDRDISASVFLDDPKSYEGGDFQFFTDSILPPVQEQGTILVFPSLMTHQVTKVKKGKRHSLVLWGSNNNQIFEPSSNMEIVEQENA
tara:strand:- start:27 stop:635 length:609 start_codon:yes stop_codon:yes gene_type:complete